MGHITLGIADIEFLGADEIVLDDDDVVLLVERPVTRRHNVARHTLTRTPSPARPTARVSFDEMQTAVRAVPRSARAR